MQKTKTLSLLVLTAILSLFVMQSVAFAQDAPPSLANPFGEPVEEEVDDTPPTLELDEPDEEPPIEDDTHDSAPDLPESGPGAILLIAGASAFGGALLNRSKK